MDERTRRAVGWVVVAVGAVVAVVGAFADQLGLGGNGPNEFGPRQVAAVAVGVVLVAVGLAIALWRSTGEESRQSDPAETGAETDAETGAETSG